LTLQWSHQDNLSVPSSRVKICPEVLVMNYRYSLSNNPEQHSSHRLRGGSLKSHVVSDILSFMLERSNFTGHSGRLQLFYTLIQQLLFIADSPTLKTTHMPKLRVQLNSNQNVWDYFLRAPATPHSTY
jgi:hypothetical protein